MDNYTDPSTEFKLNDLCDAISRRNLGIFSMWLTGRGVPEVFHEFVTALFVAGNWYNTKKEEVTLKRMARAISPGADVSASILRAFNRLKKNSPRFFDWQDEQSFQIIEREVVRYPGATDQSKSAYSFPDFEMIRNLFNLPYELTERQIRAEVAKALRDSPLPIMVPRKPRKRHIESAKRLLAKTMAEILELADSPEQGELEILEILRQVLHPGD